VKDNLKRVFNFCVIVEAHGPTSITCRENNSAVSCEVKEGYLCIVVATDSSFRGKCRKKNLDKRCKSPVSGEKSDILLFFEKNNKMVCIFTEFKSSEIKKAIRQLINTVKWFKQKFNTYQYKMGAVLIHHGSVPKNIKDKKIKQLEKELNELLDSKLLKKRSYENISNYVYSLF